MKLKLTLMAMAATLALSYQAKAGVLMQTTNHARLNVSITITTNTPEVGTSPNFHNGTKTTKFSTKDLLDLFAHWDSADRTVEPWKSAQLVQGFDSQWNGDVLVVDKTGTNVLFDANDGVNDFFIMNFFQDFGTETFSVVDANPGHFSPTERGTGSWTLVDNGVFLTGTFLGDDDGEGGIGSAMTAFTQNWDKNGVDSTWHVNATMETPEEADQVFRGTSSVTTRGTIQESGHGLGSNNFFLNKLD